MLLLFFLLFCFCCSFVIVFDCPSFIFYMGGGYLLGYYFLKFVNGACFLGGVVLLALRVYMFRVECVCVWGDRPQTHSHTFSPLHTEEMDKSIGW